MHSVGNHLLLQNLNCSIGMDRKYDVEYIKARECGQEAMFYYFDDSKHVEIRSLLEKNMTARRSQSRKIKEENNRTLYQNVQLGLKDGKKT